MDVEVVSLCELLGVLPSQLLKEDPEWIWRMKAILAVKAEKAEKDSK